MYVFIPGSLTVEEQKTISLLVRNIHLRIKHFHDMYFVCKTKQNKMGKKRFWHILSLKGLGRKKKNANQRKLTI